MKIRNGFVSNSSSSSFVVAFKEVPKSEKELQIMLYGDAEEIKDEFYDDYHPTSTLAEIVYRDFKGKKLLRPEENVEDLEILIDEVSSGYYDGCPPHDFGPRPEEEKIKAEAKAAKKDAYKDEPWKTKLWAAIDNYYAQLEEKNKAGAVKVVDKFLKNNKGCRIAIFSYSDNDGHIYCHLEHGGTFDNLQHIRISHH